ncbi:MAG: NADH-quinone oxidoreductase subunit 5 family protein [Pseudonocardiaceae bacterium]
MKRWPYVVLTALVSIAVAVWAIPHLGDDSSPKVTYNGNDVGPALPSLSLDTVVDPMAAQVMLLAAGVALLVQIYSTAYMGDDKRYRSYALLIVLFLIAMVAVVATDNLFVLLIGWEVMGVCSYLLIGHAWELPQARAGAAKAFLVTRIADIGLLVAIIVLGQTYGSYSIERLIMSAGVEEPRNATAIGLLLILAVAGKSAQVPLHTWLPDAMPGPTPITALIHAATMVAAGVYLLARLLPVYETSQVAMTTLAVMAAVTMLLAALFALVQTDLKRALAWSTVSQLALMFAAISTGDGDAGITHLVSHGAFKALLFLGCGVAMVAVGSSALSAMGGLRASVPITFWTMTIGFAALAGVVPTVGFFSKDGVLHALHGATDGEATLSGGTAWLVLLVALATSVVTAMYATRLWAATFLGDGSLSLSKRPSAGEPRAMIGPLLALAFACVALSIGQDLHVGIGLLSTLVAALGIAAAWRLRDQGWRVRYGRPLAAELGIDAVFIRAVPTVTFGIARAVDEIDANGIDVYPRGGAWLAQRASWLIGAVQSARVQVYATIVAGGALLLVIGAVVAGGGS